MLAYLLVYMQQKQKKHTSNRKSPPLHPSSYRRLSEENRKLREKLATYARDRERQSRLTWSKCLLDRILECELGARPSKFPIFLHARDMKQFMAIDDALVMSENGEYFVSFTPSALGFAKKKTSFDSKFLQKSLLQLANKKCKSCSEFIKYGVDLIIASDFAERSRLKNNFPNSKFYLLLLGEETKTHEMCPQFNRMKTTSFFLRLLSCQVSVLRYIANSRETHELAVVQTEDFIDAYITVVFFLHI